MNMNKLEYKTYELTCVSPVHIGNGEKLRAFEYLYDRSRQEAYFLDESKWIRFLARHDLMDSFAGYLERTAKALKQKGPFSGQNVWEWLRGKDIPEDEIHSLVARTAQAATNTVDPEGRGTLNDIVCQSALPDGCPYIPGSSIKGALRTALLHRIIRKDEKLRAKYWRNLESVKRDARNPRDFVRNMGRTSKDLEVEGLSRLDIRGERPSQRVTNEAKSALRGLLIGDAAPVDNGLQTVILQKIDATTKADKTGNTEKGLPLFRECLPAGAKLRFQVTIDKSMMRTLGIDSMDAIWECAREFTQDSMRAQKEIFGAEYAGEFAEAANAGLLLGGGVGFHAKSLIASLAPSPEAARAFIVDFLDQTFRNHKHATLDNRISPRTLKLTRDRNNSHIMGLCEVSSC